LIAARVIAAIGARLTIATGLAITATSCFAHAALCAQLIGLGGGLGLLVPPMTSTLLGSVTKQYSGVASGVLNAMRQTGSAIGVALFGSLLSGAGGFIAGVRIALVIAAALALCAIIAAIVGVPRRA
jgi:MFS transporter, DHA2 family, methylenomycin A resistance protein